MFRKLTWSSIALLLTVNSFALNEAFQKRFQTIKNDAGEIIEIRDASLSFKFTLRPYVEFIKSSLKEEQAIMQEKGFYFEEVEELLVEDALDQGLVNNENIQRTLRALSSLKGVDLDKIFAREDVKEVLTKFEGKLSKALSMLNPTVVARLDTSNYFYTKNVTHKVVTWGLDFAAKRLSSVPVLNTVSFVIKEVESMIVQRREYHQNMLLHYFERLEEGQLGMSAEEVDFAYSSIYESKIPWFAYWESKTAKENWRNYGVNKFFQNFRLSSTRLRSQKFRYSELGERVNFAFQEAVYKDESVLINLVEKESMINSMPAIAYSFDRPKRVLRKRTVLRLAELGLSFVSLPNSIKSIATNFMKSYYEKQVLTEGALYAHFDIEGNEKMKKNLSLQMVNPYKTIR